LSHSNCSTLVPAHSRELQGFHNIQKFFSHASFSQHLPCCSILFFSRSLDLLLVLHSIRTTTLTETRTTPALVRSASHGPYPQFDPPPCHHLAPNLPFSVAAHRLFSTRTMVDYHRGTALCVLSPIIPTSLSARSANTTPVLVRPASHGPSPQLDPPPSHSLSCTYLPFSVAAHCLLWPTLLRPLSSSSCYLFFAHSRSSSSLCSIRHANDNKQALSIIPLYHIYRNSPPPLPSFFLL